MNRSIGYSVGDPPYHYDGGVTITVIFRTDRELIESVLPPALSLPDGPARAVVRVVHPERSTFGPYIGVYLSVPALFEGRPVLHCLTGMKNNFQGVLGGRESWGMPLQVGEATSGWNGDTWNVVAGRNGVDFVRLSLRLESRSEAPPPWGQLTFASRRHTFESDSTQNVLVTVKSSAEGTEAINHWQASSVLKLVGGLPGDDWSMFPVHEVLETRYASAGGISSLHRGEILAEW